MTFTVPTPRIIPPVAETVTPEPTINRWATSKIDHLGAQDAESSAVIYEPCGF